MELEMILCASPTYFAQQTFPNNLNELKNHKCITSINRSIDLSKIHWSFYGGKKIIKVMPNSIIEVDSLRAQIDLISLGAGIGRVPSIFVEKEIKEGTLIKVLPSIELPKSYVYLLYSNRKNLPKKLQLFIDFIKDYAF